MTHPVSGLVPILATPFDDSGALDTASLNRLVDFQLWCGVDGVATFGMASEGFALTTPERSAVLAVLAARVPSGMPIVAGVNATSTATAVEQARLAAESGATGLMVLPPYLVKPSPGQLVEFYGEVAAVGLPVMVQDAPVATGVTMPVPMLVELSKLDGVTSVKVETQPTAPKVSAVVDAVEDDFAVLGGQNALFVLEEYARGAVGTMPACEFADALRLALVSFAADALAAARAEFARLLPLIRSGMQGPIAWAVHKHVLVQRGVIASDRVRLPAAPLSAADRRDIDTLLHDLALPEFAG
ncbi:dihydrodipicolinate synthase family protein [Tenggerimyces flavus]|uniref:Dihydrodipicolinate synthase family protein n=1 Tax=Tenggerimyces flavus TaxID=1708749 RepID=A0ABV7Y7W7_9ACTN|nr:dihydrodipicolinate synthase family protein [Tenggerimyces flavus]MBM7791057.1 4-hydroxy-tetrahydrodipicolinate synthase [Tenggerimyces flavus]